MNLRNSKYTFEECLQIMEAMPVSLKCEMCKVNDTEYFGQDNKTFYCGDCLLNEEVDFGEYR